MECCRLPTHNQSLKFLPCHVIALGYGHYNYSVDISAGQNAVKDLKETQA